MATIPLGTSWVSPDEPCLGLFELDYQSPGNRGFHRYQIAQVIRDGQVAEYREDLGPSKKFKGVPQRRFPGGTIDPQTRRIFIVETVGRLKEAADTGRNFRMDRERI